jgi:hypothetical protein
MEISITSRPELRMLLTPRVLSGSGVFHHRGATESDRARPATEAGLELIPEAMILVMKHAQG